MATGHARDHGSRIRALAPGLTAGLLVAGLLLAPSPVYADSTEVPAQTPAETADDTPDDTPGEVTPPAPEAEEAPFVPLSFGDRGNRVRHLQSRLHQLGLHSEVITRRFDAETRRGVRAFKAAHHLPGRPRTVNRVTWEKLVTLTAQPTKDALNNVYVPGKARWKLGSRAPAVRRIEARLAQRGHFTRRVNNRYDRRTRTAVRAFQRSARIPVTGQVDTRTRDRLWAATRKPTRSELRNWQFDLDDRCLKGRVLCIDKTTRSLKWVVDGQVKVRLAARFGGPAYPTREGTFHVFRKSRDHVSSIYHSPMPFAMFFSGGQAVHYSDHFKRTGYNGASHGCVNIRNRKAITKLFDQVAIGDKVVVYWS